MRTLHHLFRSAALDFAELMVEQKTKLWMFRWVAFFGSALLASVSLFALGVWFCRMRGTGILDWVAGGYDMLVATCCGYTCAFALLLGRKHRKEC